MLRWKGESRFFYQQVIDIYRVYGDFGIEFQWTKSGERYGIPVPIINIDKVTSTPILFLEQVIRRAILWEVDVKAIFQKLTENNNIFIIVVAPGKDKDTILDYYRQKGISLNREQFKYMDELELEEHIFDDLSARVESVGRLTLLPLTSNICRANKQLEILKGKLTSGYMEESIKVEGKITSIKDTLDSSL